MSLTTLTATVADHGPLLMFALGFVEFVGLPVATVPFLVAMGAMAGMAGGEHVLPLVVAAAAGGLAADMLLFGLTRWTGQRMIDAACGLTSNPGACVYGVAERLERLGGRYLVLAKLVPGAANLVAPAAAMAGMGAVRFLVEDAAALLLWAGLYTGLGWVFADEVEALIAGLSAYSYRGGLVAAGLIGLALVWRIVRLRRGHHPSTGGRPLAHPTSPSALDPVEAR